MVMPVGEDPDELEVYGTDTTTGPMLTSYKFEVYAGTVCACIQFWRLLKLESHRNSECCDKSSLFPFLYSSLC